MAHFSNIKEKLNVLCNNSRWEQFANANNVTVIGDVNINNYEKMLLSLGLSFSVDTQKADLANSISSINNFNYWHPDVNMDFLKGACIQAFANRNQPQVLPKRFQNALDSLTKNKEIKVMKADKGGAVVVMSKQDYYLKALRLLSDADTYEKIDNPPTIAEIQTDFSKKVKNIISQITNDDMKNVIKSKVNNILPSFPYFYGPPKVHKNGIPLRPIVATCGSPQSKLAKWLADSLSTLLGKISNSHLLHSSDFISRIRNLGPTHGKLISLDVTALFTNVPIDFVLDNLKRAADSNIFQPPIPIEQFCDLVRLCVDATIFTFEGQVYKQKFGVAMGSPLSPILANLCLEFMEEYHIKPLPEDIKPFIWVRYVDDIFIIYQHDLDAFNNFLHEINSILPTIKFTVEEEENGQLPFLDVMVIHNKLTNNFSFKIYRKPTNAENYVHFYSNHAINVKRNIVTNMYTRALRICDTPHLEAEFNHIQNAFIRLGYPKFFLNRCLSSAKQNYYNPKNATDKREPHRLTLPYSSQLSNIQKAIKVANRYTPGQPVDVTFKYNNTLRSKLVQNRAKEVKNDVGVYCLPCLQCPSSYLGETGRSLAIRLEEHKKACREGKNYSAVATHSIDIGHRIGFNEAKIVYKCQNRNMRRLVEGALISLNNTFDNNTSSTKEDKIVNSLICQSLNIKNYCNIKAMPDIPAAFPLNPQVITHDNDAHLQIPPEPPDNGLRRSNRIRNRDNLANRIITRN